MLKVCVLMEGSDGTVEDSQAAPLQIYNVPYEAGGDCDRTAVSRPELDPRPSTEYELPWEWKKEHIVKTLSGTPDEGFTMASVPSGLHTAEKNLRTRSEIASVHI